MQKVLRLFVVVAGCNFAQVVEVGRSAEQVERNHSPEQVASKPNIAHRSKTIAPLSNLEVILMRVEAVHRSQVVAAASGQIVEEQMLALLIQLMVVNHSKHSLPCALFQ